MYVQLATKTAADSLGHPFYLVVNISEEFSSATMDMLVKEAASRVIVSPGDFVIIHDYVAERIRYFQLKEDGVFEEKRYEDYMSWCFS